MYDIGIPRNVLFGNKLRIDRMMLDVWAFGMLDAQADSFTFIVELCHIDLTN